MITFDGDRSLKRKWFAKKQLAIIQEIDVPAKVINWDGFTFRAWQQGEDLNGGRVTAPMGAVVACSSADGIKIAVADYWAGGFNAEQDLYVVFKDLGVSGEFTTFFNGPIDIPPDPVPEDYEPEYFTVKFTPEIGSSWFGLIDGDTGGPDTVNVPNYPCSPVLMSWQGEAYNIMLSATVKYDLDENGVYDWIRHVFEKNTSFYCASGQQLNRLNCVARQIEYADAYDPMRTYQKTGTDRYTSYHGAWLYDFVDSVKVVGYHIDVTSGTVDNIQFNEILNTDMPSELRSILINTVNDSSCEPIGSYATDTMFFHAVNASAHLYSWGREDCEVTDYYDANPDKTKWRLFYSMTIDGTVYLVNCDQFAGLLNSLSLNGTTGDWYAEQRMFSQLVAAYPNCNWLVPSDSVMFHAHDGNLYTWTRPYGAVQITTTGISVATISVPIEVSGEDGVRPEITYAGTFDTVPTYLCICNKVKEEVKAVYVGSPFDTWTKLPGVESGLTLFHVRPVKVTPTSIFLIGVIKETVTIEGVSTDYYNFASLSWSIDDGVPSTALWNKMGRLPFTVSDNDNLQVGLYGDDSRVNELAAYLTPPPIMPQSPVGPYAKYAIGLP